MKFVEPSHLTGPDAAARKLMEIAHTAEAVQDGRINIEPINEPFLRQAARPPSSARVSTARSPGACGVTRAGPSCGSPQPGPSCSPERLEPGSQGT
jgi:hypothetical protein